MNAEAIKRQAQDENNSPEILAQLIEEKNDATLEELCQMFQAKTKVIVSRATMGRMSQRLNLTLKKNALCSGKED